MKLRNLIAIALAAIVYAAPALAELSGKDVYIKTCGLCHATGLAGAPKFGNAADWGPRLTSGVARLYVSALQGTPRGMPGKGGNLTYSDAEVKAAVDYMVAAVKVAAKPAPPPAPQKPVTKEEPKPEPKVAAAVPAVEKAVAKSSSVAAAADSAPAGDVNAFNRLLKTAGKRNLPPTEDGIHDPANDGTSALLPPLSAYADLPKSLAGNRVNWVEAIEKKKINPRWDRADPKA